MSSGLWDPRATTAPCCCNDTPGITQLSVLTSWDDRVIAYIMYMVLCCFSSIIFRYSGLTYAFPLASESLFFSTWRNNPIRGFTLYNKIQVQVPTLWPSPTKRFSTRTCWTRLEKTFVRFPCHHTKPYQRIIQPHSSRFSQRLVSK